MLLTSTLNVGPATIEKVVLTQLLSIPEKSPVNTTIVLLPRDALAIAD